MKLDRNLNADGRGKYGLIKNRRLAEIEAGRDAGPASAMQADAVEAAIRMLEATGVLDWGDTVDTEFFAIRLRDKGAGGALDSYARNTIHFGGDKEYAQEVFAMSARSGFNHPNPKTPD